MYREKLKVANVDSAYRHYEFEHDLEKLVGELQDRYPDKTIRIVLLLDEMDQFTSYSTDIHSQFRSIFNARVGSHLRIVMCGVSIQQFKHTRTSPWYNLFKVIELPPLERSSASQLVVEPAMGYYTFEPGAVEAILSTSDLKPQDIQLLSSLAVTIMLDRVTEVTTTVDEDVVVHEAIIT